MLDREDFYTEYSPVVNTQMYPNYEREGRITAQFLFSRQELFKWFENNYEQVPHDSQRYTWSYMDDDTIINGMRNNIKIRKPVELESYIGFCCPYISHNNKL